MKGQDRGEGLLGCLLLFSRLIAVMAAGTGMVRGLLTGDLRMMVASVLLSFLFYGLVWLGVRLILKGIKRRK